MKIEGKNEKRKKLARNIQRGKKLNKKKKLERIRGNGRMTRT